MQPTEEVSMNSQPLVPVPLETKLANKNRSNNLRKFGSWTRLTTKNTVAKEFLSEMIGEFFLIYFGLASHTVLRLRYFGVSGRDNTFLIGIPFGVGALIGISASLEVSGAHLNPAVTTAVASIKKFPLKKVTHFVIAHHVGGFLSAVVLWIIYREGLNNYEKNIRQSSSNESHVIREMASFFTTFPFSDHESNFEVSLFTCFIDQIFCTGVLVFAICTIEGSGIPKKFLPYAAGLMLIGLIMTCAYNAGAILNPARDFPPRLFASMLYGFQVFASHDYIYWWLVGIVAPHVGGILGAWAYVLLINPSFVDPVPTI